MASYSLVACGADIYKIGAGVSNGVGMLHATIYPPGPSETEEYFGALRALEPRHARGAALQSCALIDLQN